jgi:hypothetical protein
VNPVAYVLLLGHACGIPLAAGLKGPKPQAWGQVLPGCFQPLDRLTRGDDGDALEPPMGKRATSVYACLAWFTLSGTHVLRQQHYDGHQQLELQRLRIFAAPQRVAQRLLLRRASAPPARL